MTSLLDFGTTSPRTLSAKNMSNELAKLLIGELLLGNFATNAWQDEFLSRVCNQRTFTIGQRTVIYNLAFKFHIL